MVASTARPELLYSASTSTRSTTASPRFSIPSTACLEPSTSNKRVWVGRHLRCRPLFELAHLAGGPGGTDNMLHVSAPKKRRVEPGALLDLVAIGNIADEDVNDLLLGFVGIDRSQAGKLLVHPGKKKVRVLIPVVGDGFELPFEKQCFGLTTRPSPIQKLAPCIPRRYGRQHSLLKSSSRGGVQKTRPCRLGLLHRQLPRRRPKDTPMTLGLAAPAAHRTAKLNHVGPPLQGQE